MAHTDIRLLIEAVRSTKKARTSSSQPIRRSSSSMRSTTVAMRLVPEDRSLYPISRSTPSHTHTGTRPSIG